MNIFKLMLNKLSVKFLSLLLVAVLSFNGILFIASDPSKVLAVSQLQGGDFFVVSNAHNPGWQPIINAEVNDLVEFKAEISNTGSDPLRNVKVRASLNNPGPLSNSIVSQFFITADGFPIGTHSAQDGAGVVVTNASGPVNLVYFPGHAHLVTASGTTSLESIGSGDWVSIPDVPGGDFSEVLFKVQVVGENPQPTPTPTPMPTPSPTPTSTPNPTPTPTPVPTATPVPTPTSTPIPTPTGTPHPTATPTPVPTATPTPVPTPTGTPQPTPTPTPVPSVTPTPTPSTTPIPTPTGTPHPTPTSTPQPTATPTSTPVPTVTPTPSATPTGGTNINNQNNNDNNNVNKLINALSNFIFNNNSQSQSQSQNNNQTITQSQSQNVTVHQTVTATATPTPTNTPTPTPASQVKGMTITELPRTGVESLSWILVSLIPTGFGLMGLKRKREDSEDPTYIWEKKQFSK